MSLMNSRLILKCKRWFLPNFTFCNTGVNCNLRQWSTSTSSQCLNIETNTDESEINHEDKKPSKKFDIETNTDESEINHEDKKLSKTTKNKTLDTALIKLPKKQLSNTNSIGSVIVSLQEIACVTMKRDLTVTNWQRYPIFTSKSKRKAMSNIEGYYKRISDAYKAFPSDKQDLWIMEERYIKLSVPFLSSHFLISKTILHTLLAETFANHDDRRVVYGLWIRTGRYFDLMIDGNLRKSGKEKVAEIFKSGTWCGRNVLNDSKLIKVTDSNILIRDNSISLEENDGSPTYNKMTEEMADAYLQALAFWLTSECSD